MSVRSTPRNETVTHSLLLVALLASAASAFAREFAVGTDVACSEHSLQTPIDASSKGTATLLDDTPFASAPTVRNDGRVLPVLDGHGSRCALNLGEALSSEGKAAYSTSALASVGELIRNGGFDQQQNPLAFWLNAPGALATWSSDGANGSQGSVQLRFVPPGSSKLLAKGAVFYTGLTQCVPVPHPGTYVLGGYARVTATASPSSFAGIRWVLRSNEPQCLGPITSSGRVGLPRSTAWVAALASIQVEPQVWTANTTIEVELQAGDSSTQSIETVEALIDEITLFEGPLFGDSFEGD
jgi:hypothetical protein